MDTLDITINGFKFQKINHPFFEVYGEENQFPFLHSQLYDLVPSSIPRRVYKSIFVNGEFYAPIKKNND